MIEIVRDQVVYNAGSNLEVSCVYRNTTGKDRSAGGGPRPQTEVERLLEAARNGYRDENDVPRGTIVWLHDGEKFSHRNRRR